MPLAEDSDLIIDMDLNVMQLALRELGRWQQSDPTLQMNVNLSGRHFDHEEWLTPIYAATEAAGVPPRSVNIEITETALLPNTQRLSAGVKQLSDLGFKVWLDDFGTGWSSLEYLLRMPVYGIKLSQAVSVTLGSRVGDALVRAVTSLAGELHLHTTIEGIETPRNEALARRLGCDNAQGYLWSQALPASQAQSLSRHNLQSWQVAN